MTMKVIRYHGTSSVRTARIILEQGFADGTFFAHHLEDALGYGGGHVFEVVFEDEDAQGDGWQCVSGVVGPERIMNYTKYIQTPILDRPELRNLVWESQKVKS